jgi:hypothetical protein
MNCKDWPKYLKRVVTAAAPLLVARIKNDFSAVEPAESQVLTTTSALQSWHFKPQHATKSSSLEQEG